VEIKTLPPSLSKPPYGDKNFLGVAVPPQRGGLRHRGGGLKHEPSLFRVHQKNSGALGAGVSGVKNAMWKNNVKMFGCNLKNRTQIDMIPYCISIVAGGSREAQTGHKNRRMAVIFAIWLKRASYDIFFAFLAKTGKMNGYRDYF
jgi:hypothetical protein